jgi:hypothetical protein
VPFGFQLIPAGIMAFGLLTVKVGLIFPLYGLALIVTKLTGVTSLASSVGRNKEALENLAYLRKDSPTSSAVVLEMTEMETSIKEEKESRKGLGLKVAFLGKGNLIRFVIAFVIFLLQQWGGQNSIGYYAPQIFTAVCAFIYSRDM